MSIRLAGEIYVYKDEKGRYITCLSGNELNENGETQKIYHRLSVSFRKGIELKNKTKINVKDGFLGTYRYKTGELNANGNPDYKYYVKMIILDFDVIEEGNDDVVKRHEVKQNENQNFGFNNNSNNDNFGWGDDDELPF